MKTALESLRVVPVPWDGHEVSQESNGHRVLLPIGQIAGHN